LTLAAKYKEDLDQMMTNWMVNYRPDIYVRWWHPRNKSYPLESEILWNGQISLDDTADYEPTKRIQYKAKAEFTFKSWIFSGLNDINDKDQKLPELVSFINIFPQANNTITSEWDDMNTTYNQWEDITQFPVVGKKSEIYDINELPDGQFAAMDVPLEEFKENIKNGEVLDLTLAGDLPGNIMQNFYPRAMTYYGYLTPDKPFNEQIIFKYCYFHNARPISSFLVDKPSGDLLFQTFFTETQRFTDYDKSLVFKNSIANAEFGVTNCDSLAITYSYDVDNKLLTIDGRNKNYRYDINIRKSNFIYIRNNRIF
jgi:hypothetical protein